MANRPRLKNALQSQHRPDFGRERLTRRLAFEPLEARQLLSRWLAQGPAIAANGQVENLATTDGNAAHYDQVSGAIQTIAVHPTDANIVLVGAVNGGIWRTTNYTATSPTWTPVTDQAGSLSIGALDFDWLDASHNTLVAGVGAFSSFGVSNAGQGVLRTTDGGGTWSPVAGNATLVGTSITGIAERGATIVLSSSASGKPGVYRSTNSGTSFSLISGSNGLTAGRAYDLAGDPTSTSRLYTAVGGVGVFYSSDAGATWSNISSADTALNTAFTGGVFYNARMAVSPVTGRLWVAVGQTGRIAYIGYSDNRGGTWTQMDLPITNDSGTLNGANPESEEDPGGQVSIHLAIAADPTNANLVYIGGDRQPGPFTNSIGSNDYSGRLFRGNAAVAAVAPGSATNAFSPQWASLTNVANMGFTASSSGTANNSSPHADERRLAFDRAGNLLNANDGGLYVRTSPQDNTGRWWSKMGDGASAIQVTEMHDVAWDTVSQIIIGGNQDTGSTMQTATGSLYWDSISTGDGGDVAVDALIGGGQSLRYSSYQNLGGLRRQVYGAANNLVSTSYPTLTVAGGAAAPTYRFTNPIATNDVAANRLIVGATNGVYESTDRGDNITRIDTNAVNYNAIAYGGMLGVTPNAEVLWVGSGSTVRRRFAAGALTAATALPGGAGTVTDIALDPTNYNTAYVVDGAHVYATSDGGTSWSNVTGSLSATNLQTVVVIYPAGSSTAQVLVGSLGGVWSMSAASPGVWTAFGPNLPRTFVYDLQFDATRGMLVAGTLGRGAWVMGTTPPSTTTVAVNDVTLTDADVGAGKFTVTATYSAAMDSAVAPAISFSPVASSSLTFASGNWTDATHYTATYNVADANLELAAIGVGVSAGQDIFGNIQNIYSGSNKFSIDTLNPSITSLSPADNAGNVSASTNLVITLSENVQKGVAGNVVLKKSSDNSLVETIPVTGARVTVSATQVTVDPATVLGSSTDYYVQIDAGAIQDLAGNSFAGISSSTTWNFSTGLTFGGPTVNVAGIGNQSLSPPDTVGDVGPTRYVQTVNAATSSLVRIFDKTGATLSTFTLSSLGGPVGAGDPVVLYDNLADRWLISEFAETGNTLIIHLSKTGTPTSNATDWYLYTFDTPNFPDYPKFAVWPDAYYVTSNETGVPVYALDRGNMLAGQTPRTMQRFTAPDGALSGFDFQALTPADLDGTSPPAGAPAYFMRHRDTESHTTVPQPPAGKDLVQIYQLHVDFATPANSSFTGPTNIQVQDFDSNLNGLTAFSCFAQPGTTTKLDPLREIIMQRLQYRNFGSYESIVGNFVTDVDGTDHGGVRWFELRKSGAGAWTLFQEGTVAPDASSRWLGAIAMDGQGNIALGYNVTDATVTYPSLRYTGRLVTDPLGVMPQGEFTIKAGAGSQTGSTRWGDYQAMGLDPLDDRTFWLTGEYVDGSHLWQTQVAAFGFPTAANDLVTVSAADPVGNGSNNSTADAFRLVRNGTLVEIYVDGKLSRSFPATVAKQIVFAGSNDNDTLTVDFSGGNPLPTGGIVFNGAGGTGDALTLIGGSATSLEYLFDTDLNGFVKIDGTTAVTYTGLTSATDDMSVAARVFTFNGGAETIALSDSGIAGKTKIDSTLGAAVTFANPTTALTINPGAGIDTINASGLGSAYNANLNLSDPADTVNVTGFVNLGSGVLALTANACNIGVGGSLLAAGTVNAFTSASGGLLSPAGAGTGTLAQTGTLVLGSGSQLALQVNGTTPGTQYDQLVVNGTVSLASSAVLNLAGTVGAIPGQSIILVNNDGTDAVTGFFSGLPEGATVVVNGRRFTISYRGGSGNDVTLLQDGVAPSVIGFSPVDNSTNVNLSTDLLIDFNELMQKGLTGNVVIKKAADNSTVESLPITSSRINVAGGEVVIDPATTLAYSSGYYVQIDAGALLDLGGNPYGGIADSTTWNFTTAGYDAWLEQGPRPIRNAQVNVPPNDLATGAIESVAVNPYNTAQIYVATVNGGLWRTNNADPSNPDTTAWTPLSDQVGSLAMGDLAFSPLDPAGNTLFAGTGSYSSLGQAGGPAIGVLRTTDGGLTWSTFSLPAAQYQIKAIVPTAIDLDAGAGVQEMVLVGTLGGGGLYRSNDNGQTYTALSGANGLPAGDITQLIVDPNNSQRFYAGVAYQGVYRGDFSASTGIISWIAINTGITGIATAANIQIAAGLSAPSTVVFALLSGANYGAFRSADSGASWTALATPSTLFNRDVTVRAGNTMVVDPTNDQIAYITTYGGGNDIYRYNPSGGGSWVLIDEAGASGNTAPHADGRDLAFQGSNVLIDTNDGGIYFLQNPQNATANAWHSYIGDGGTGVGCVEFHNIAWDSVSNVVVGGAQDNGTEAQLAPGNTAWNWFSGGDGGDVVIDTTTLAASSQSIRYFSSQNLGGFRRQTVNAAGANVGGTVGLIPVAGLSGFVGQFVNPVEINAVPAAMGKSQRIVIGGGTDVSNPVGAVYEADNAGIAANAAAVNWVQIPVGAGFTSVSAMAYGGRRLGVDNPDVLYVGSNNKVFVRTAAGGTLSPTTTSFPGTSVRDIVLDPNDWQHAFVISATGVWETSNAGGAWTARTGNLVNADLRTIQYIGLGSSAAVLVGGRGGVFLMRTSAPGVWNEFGQGMPNAVTFDLEYNTTDDVLLAGTLGRGAWTIPHAQIVLKGGPPIITNLAVVPNLIAEANVGTARLTVTINFDVQMNTALTPAITFPAENPGGALLLNTAQSGWIGATTYVAKYDVVDTNLTLPNIDLRVTGAADALGNVLATTDFVDRIGIDTQSPAVTALSVNHTQLTDSLVGSGRFTVSLTYSEPMATATRPTLAFTPNVSSTLSLASGSWLDALHYQAIYDVADANVIVYNVGITATMALDPAGNSQAPYVGVNDFNINTLGPDIGSLTAWIETPPGDNFDFEAAQLAPWSTLNAGPTPGPYEIATFDVGGTGRTSRAFRLAPDSGAPDGIRQTVQLDGGVPYAFYVPVAEANSGAALDLGVGNATLAVDGTIIAAFDFHGAFGDIGPGGVFRGALQGTYTPATSGAHTLTLTFDRSASELTTLWAYADDVTVGRAAGTLVNDAVAGAQLTIAAVFNAAMNPAIAPQFDFTPALSSTLIPNVVASRWISNRAYLACYTIADAGATALQAGVNVTGARDPGGALQAPGAFTDVLHVDTQNPAVSVNPRVSKMAQPTLFGSTGDPGPGDGIAAVTVRVAGQTLAATLNGSLWSVVLSAPLADGQYDVQASVVDKAGNTAQDVTTGELIIDTVAPTITVTPVFTNNSRPTLSGTVADPTPASGIVEVSVTVGTQTLIATVIGTDWSVDLPLPLDDGWYDVVATATDAAGNSVIDGTVSDLAIDSLAPTVSIDMLVSNDTTPTLSGTIIDPDPSGGIDWVSVTVGGQTFAANLNGEIWTATVPFPLADGTHDVQVRAVDKAGNTASDSTTNELYLDSIAPVVSVTRLVTSNNRPRLEGTAYEPLPGSGFNTLSVSVWGRELTHTLSGGVWTADLPIALLDGVYEVRATATDLAGNVAIDATSKELVIDTVAPVVTVNRLAARDRRPVLSGTVSDHLPSSGLTGVTVVVGGQTLSATINGNSWTAAVLADLNDGTYDVQATTVDAAGHIAQDASTAELTLDATPPVVTVNPLSASSSTPTLSGTAIDPGASGGIAAVMVSVAGQSRMASLNGSLWSVAMPAPLSDGIYDVRVTALDVAGNNNSDTTADELSVDVANPTVTSLSVWRPIAVGDNFNFERGDLSAWTVLNQGDQPGPYQVAAFDVGGSGKPSFAFRVSPNSGVADGISREVWLEAGGTYTLDVAIAEENRGGFANSGVDQASLLVDGTVISTFSFVDAVGQVPAATTYHAALHGTYVPAITGAHMLSITFWRRFAEFQDLWAYADDVSISKTSPLELRAADVGSRVEVVATYSETMDVVQSPRLSFTPDVAQVLVLDAASSHWASNLTYVAVYRVAPGPAAGSVAVNIADAQDAVHNSQTAASFGDRFDVSTVAARPTTCGIYDPLESRFYLKYVNSEGVADVTFGFGAPGWKPISGDWNGDGCDTIGLFQPEAAHFYLRNTNSSGPSDIDFGYGDPAQGDQYVMVMGDWNGDGVDTIGLYHKPSATWFLRNSNTQGVADITFGFGVPQSNWMPLVGDWNGDGIDTIGLYDPSTGMFYLRNSQTTGVADIAFPFGTIGAGWMPIIGDWDGDGQESVGFYQAGPASHFYLMNGVSPGSPVVHFGLGFAGCQPIVGDWLGPAQALNAADGTGNAEGEIAAVLTCSPRAITPLVTEAIARWQTIGVTIAPPQVIVTDLPGTELGRAVDNMIYLDRDAAGHGWFVDLTPNADEEFSVSAVDHVLRVADSAAIDRIDLLTVIEHELGHLAGLPDLESSLSDLMSGRLSSGERRTVGLVERAAIGGLRN